MGKKKVRNCSNTSTKTETEKSPWKKSMLPNQTLKLKSSNMLIKMVMVSGASQRSKKPSNHWLKCTVLPSRKDGKTWVLKLSPMLILTRVEQSPKMNWPPPLRNTDIQTSQNSSRMRKKKKRKRRKRGKERKEAKAKERKEAKAKARKEAKAKERKEAKAKERKNDPHNDP